MSDHLKDQNLHSDLPEEFQGNFERNKSQSKMPWDMILLAITIFYLIQDNKEDQMETK